MYTYLFGSGKNIVFSPFKMHKIIFIYRKTEKKLGFSSKFRYGRVTLNTGIFYLALAENELIWASNLHTNNCWIIPCICIYTKSVDMSIMYGFVGTMFYKMMFSVH